MAATGGKSPEQQRRELVHVIQSEDLRRFRQMMRQETVAALLSSPIDTNGHHALHLAVLSGFEEGVDLLMEHPAVNINACTPWRETPLHMAVENEFNTIAQGLLSTGRCQLDLTNKKRNETVLHVAARVGNTFALKELLEQSGFNVHATDVDGNTALHLAVLNGRCEITRHLLLAGLDPKSRNSQQKTPMFIAMHDLNNPRLTEVLVRTKRPMMAVPPRPVHRNQHNGVSLHNNKWNNAGRRQAGAKPAVVNPNKKPTAIFQTEVPAQDMKAKPAQVQKEATKDVRKETPKDVPKEMTKAELEKARKNLKSAGVQVDIDAVNEIDERPAPKLSKDYYKMDARPRGICLIFNNERYWHEDFQERSGADVDENRLTSLFHRLNFKVKIHKNLNAAEMFWEVMNIARHTDHSSYDCFVCCILSHGALGTIYGVDGDSFRISELTIALTARRCPSLAGKPKMFFIQACRGDDVQGLLDHEHAHDSQLGADPARMVPDHADFLLGYATVAGYRAQRHRSNGSLYVQTLCRHMHALHKHQDLLSILTKVNAETAEEVFETPCGAKYKQMPEVRHTLTKAILMR